MADGTVPNTPDDNNPQHSPLSAPLWPPFDDGAFLNSTQATRFYRAALGITGLIQVLDRSNNLREDREHFEDAADLPLSPNHEHNLWCALSVLSTDLVYLADDLLQRAEEPL